MADSGRGEIWEVQFRPAIGAEIQKTRPAVILNVPEVGRLPLCIVVPSRIGVQHLPSSLGLSI